MDGIMHECRSRRAEAVAGQGTGRNLLERGEREEVVAFHISSSRSHNQGAVWRNLAVMCTTTRHVPVLLPGAGASPSRHIRACIRGIFRSLPSGCLLPLHLTSTSLFTLLHHSALRSADLITVRGVESQTQIDMVVSSLNHSSAHFGLCLRQTDSANADASRFASVNRKTYARLESISPVLLLRLGRVIIVLLKILLKEVLYRDRRIFRRMVLTNEFRERLQNRRRMWIREERDGKALPRDSAFAHDPIC